ncbi:hypothetical protein N9I32_01210 [Porticoccaceae bacterium]|nr:hypothetical protein [Porticoccaceae bacterium]
MLNKYLFLMMIITLTACGGGGSGNGGNSNNTSNDTVQASDSDRDGVGDNADAFPNDATETLDTDGDGVGDNADAFPNDATETLDTDGDGVGDNADAFPNDATETLDTDGDGVGDNADALPNDASNGLQPSAVGELCRADESYYPLPEVKEYRKPLAGNRLEFDYKMTASSNTELEDRETNLTITYFGVDDINTVTLGPTPSAPYEPSNDWGSVWNNDVFVTAVARTEDSLENRSTVYMYPGDGTVRLIKNSLNRVYLDANLNEEVFLWGQKYQPKLSEFSTFSDVSVSYDLLNPTQRWNIFTNTSVNDTRVIMTGIGCVETMLVQKNEERNWAYDSFLNSPSDGGLIKIKVNLTELIHPTLGSVQTVKATEFFFTPGIADGEVVSGELTTLSNINFIEDMPAKVLR